MKHYPIFRVITILGVTALSFFSFALTTQAMGTATVGTTLTFQPPTPVSVGNAAIVVVQLISSKGEPVADQPVELLVNGEHERRARTDADGNVSVKVRRDEAGTYALSAIFKGSKLPSLGSSKAAADLVVTPALIEVHVTPPLPNIKFALNNQIFASDDYGVARVEVQKAGKYRLELLPLETKNPDIQMAFGRWGDEFFVPSRDIDIPLTKPLNVGLEVSYQVGQTFVDLKGKPVDRSRVTSITLKGSNGATYTFEDTLPHWIPAGRIIRLNNGLQETKILYSVISVVIDGSNVVSQAQQRFYVHQNDIWTVKLLLYTAKFTAHDALFRFPLGTGIRMEYPDGDVQTFDFSSNQGHTITGLARGIYRVTVTGADGFAPPTPIALSRNQNVDLMVFSYLDMGVLLGIGILVALGLLFFGRPHLIRQTVTLPARTVSEIRKLRPARVKEFYGRISTVEPRLVSKRENIRLENKSNAASLELPTYEEPEILNSAKLDQAETQEVLLTDGIAGPILSNSSDDGTDLLREPVSDVRIEQDEPGILASQTETSPAAPEEVQPSVEMTEKEPVSVAAEPAFTCHVCGSSELLKKETKRPNQQRYQCQACGATNNFGAKRTRKRRQKNRVESFVS